MPQLDLIATSAFGLEAIVARELADLGYQSKTIQPGRMLFQGDLAAIPQSNIWLRAADRVLLRMGNFEATDFGQLFDQTYELPWHEWIGPDAEFPVSGRSIKSQLSSVPACQKIVKKAIVEKLKAAHGVDTLAETGPKYSVEVALLNNEATLTIDTSGPGLHKRGYRSLMGRAPLKETLAAAMVMLSYWKPERQLIDPFCGTGTIPIEAAMIGRKMAPGLNREFAAEPWPQLSQDLWQNTRETARRMALPELPVRIIGTDIDTEALSLARYHAKQAGVEDDVHFQQKDFAETSSKQEYGCLIGNPPYGRRISEREEVRQLYRDMPEVFRGLQTWSFYILTSHDDFEDQVGQRAHRRRKLFNGRIKCTYFQFQGPKPEKRPRWKPPVEEADKPEDRPAVDEGPLPAFGGLTANTPRQVDEFRARLTKRAKHLRKWPTKQGITCFRLYDRDVPGVPLVVDRYEDHLHISEYDRPDERTPAQHADWLDMMVRTAGEVLGIDKQNVFLKKRRRQKGERQHERVSKEQRLVTAGEGGLKFIVNLSDYVDTGLFLDHRTTRSMVRDLATDCRFLNLFAYTGAFTVYAADGGAKSTTSVDLSNTYLDWTKKNMSLNGFGGPQHRYVRYDAMDFLTDLPHDEPFDLAVVDPPTFSNSKSLETIWDVQRDYVGLLREVLKLMSPGGNVFFSTNFRRFKFDETQFPEATIREISRQTVPPDFRNRRVHRCWRMIRR